MSLSTVVEKVQKLLALSTSSNPNEAAAAAAAANKLIDQYRLSEADLEIQGQAEEPIEEDDGYVYESGKITRWKSNLAMNLASHYGLYLWNDNYWPQGRQVSRYRLVGRKSDITICKYMFTWLTMECQRLADLYAKGQGRIYVASYCAGFVSGVSEQLAVSRKEVQGDASSAALVKINERSQLAKVFANQLHTNLKAKKSYSHSRIDGEAYASGQVSGRNVHLGQHLGAGGTKLLGS